MNRSRALYHMVRADFLERVRRYSFLLTLGFSVYLGYAVYAGQISLRVGNYRGVENSAWLGTVMGLVATVFITLTGFYVVKNSIQRDRQTRVGQILATTPISKSFYTLAKALSNFAVLAVMVLVLALGAVVIQLSHHEDLSIDFAALLAPVLVLGLSAVAVTAALAVLFESLPGLSGGVGNILYFFLWTFLTTISVATMTHSAPGDIRHVFADFTGMASTMGQMQQQVRALDSLYQGGVSFTLGNLQGAPTRTFLWTGIDWTPALLLSRATMAAIAFLIALFAAVFFDRFDPARASWLPARNRPPRPGPEEAVPAVLPTQAQKATAPAHLTPVSAAGGHFRFFALVAAELRLLLRGHGWWWYLGAAGLFIACLSSPLDAARSGVLLAAWLWPVLLWSQMGAREALFSTGPLIFSAPRAVPRQLLATYAAGVLVALLTGGGVGLHLVFARDFAGLAAWAAGALFIPALALALGVTTGSRKFFEALYTAWWYVGPAHHTPQLDFMGTTAQSSTPGAYLAAAALLLASAYVWRRVSLARA